MTRRFFITGGTGLIGRGLVRALLRKREDLNIEQLTLLTRNPDRFASIAPDIAFADGTHLLKGDMTAGEWPNESFTDIIHGATDVNDLLVSDRLAYAWGIVEGTKRTLDYAASCGCERYLYLSSGAVYGPGPYPEAGIPEDWSTAPALNSGATAYGQAKRFSEHLCALFAERTQVSTRIARIFSVIGLETPLDGQYALGSFITQAVTPHNDCIRIKGDGRASRSYLHVDDLARWLIAIHEMGAGHEVVNVGSSREITISELAHIIATHSRSKKMVFIEGSMSDYAGRVRYVPDTRLIRKRLAVSETITLESAIQSLIERAESNAAVTAPEGRHP